MLLSASSLFIDKLLVPASHNTYMEKMAFYSLGGLLMSYLICPTCLPGAGVELYNIVVCSWFPNAACGIEAI